MCHLVGSIILSITIFNQVPATDTLFPIEKWSYEAAGRRDPFVPLVGLEIGGSGKASHLNVENLRLIGIMWGDKGYYGLVKDGQNNGYILKTGDRVASGKVADINEKAIIFDLVQAGVSTKYELRLQEKERR